MAWDLPVRAFQSSQGPLESLAILISLFYIAREYSVTNQEQWKTLNSYIDKKETKATEEVVNVKKCPFNVLELCFFNK